MFKQFKNEKFILHSGIFDPEEPRRAGKFCSLPCMDIAWEMCTLTVGRKQFSTFKKEKGPDDKESHKIVINYETW